jgi:2-oxo-3-hexenedioate decarboxylase
MNMSAMLLAVHDAGALCALPSALDPSFTMAAAFAAADELRSARVARGEVPLGYKIGFTNRSIWQRYGVHAPIWGPVWDSTVRELEGTTAQVSLAGLCQPRLEPEVVFGFAHTPHPGMSLDELQGCLAWAAHGFEIVHTHFDGWRFTAADTVADFALHGRLFVGPHVATADWPDMAQDLAKMQVQLQRDGQLQDSGQGAVVLDGPLNALRLWVDAMALHTATWRIEPGDVVTTGTITDAWPLSAGESWTTTLTENRLHGLTLNTLP